MHAHCWCNSRAACIPCLRCSSCCRQCVCHNMQLFSWWALRLTSRLLNQYSYCSDCRSEGVSGCAGLLDSSLHPEALWGRAAGMPCLLAALGSGHPVHRQMLDPPTSPPGHASKVVAATAVISLLIGMTHMSPHQCIRGGCNLSSDTAPYWHDPCVTSSMPDLVLSDRQHCHREATSN